MEVSCRTLLTASYCDFVGLSWVTFTVITWVGWCLPRCPTVKSLSYHLAGNKYFVGSYESGLSFTP